MKCCLLIFSLVLVMGCTTTAEIRGPQVAVGGEFDFERGFSPKIQFGYHYMRYNAIAGYGASGGLSYSPLNDRAEIFLDGRFSTFLTFSAYVPMVVGGALAITPLGIRPGVRAGLAGSFFAPPSACTVGIEGDQPPIEEACNGEWRMEDTVHPDWLPSAEVLFHYFPVWSEQPLRYKQEETTPFVISGSFVATLASYWITGGDP